MSLTNDEQCSSIWCSVAITITEHFNFAEPKHVLEHLTLERLDFAEHRAPNSARPRASNTLIIEYNQCLTLNTQCVLRTIVPLASL
jgi:hypothetical protein